jgi:hypothetical protein
MFIEKGELKTMEKDQSLEQSILKKIPDIILKINPNDVINDAKAAGLSVEIVEDFSKQAMNYWRIDDIAEEYVSRTARWCAGSGATSGVGGIATSITLGTGDIAHMAARLYWLCQRLAVLNGFDPENPLQRDRAQEVYLVALGFDSAAQALIKQQVAQAVKIAGKRGARSNYILKLIIYVAYKLTGKQITTKYAAQFLPVVGGVAGGTLNYFFAKKAGQKMKELFRDDYFRTWQVSARQSNL